MKPQDTCLMFATSETTLGGTHLVGLLKTYVSERYDRTIVDMDILDDVVADIKETAENMHKENPRCRAVEITIEDDSHGIRGMFTSIIWIRANGEGILTLRKARVSYLKEKGGNHE